MKLRNVQLFLALFITALFVTLFAVWNIFNKPSPAYSIKVNIPKAFNPNFSDAEFEDFCLQNADIIPISAFEKFGQSCFVLPHNNRILIVSLDSKRDLKINSLDIGNFENLIPLTERLKAIFNERKSVGIFEENSDEIYKTVVVKAPLSTKYGDVVKVIDAVKTSGADPIILQIDELPE